MNITQITSVMVVSSSPVSRRPWVVGCCMQQYSSSPLRKASSHSEQANPAVMNLDMTKERIRKLFSNVEVSVSSYDTAWVAMVPSPNSPKSPCFPDCLNWLMDNQLDDGSWGLLPHRSSLIKDTLSSTLACVLALKRWNVGKDQINKGLHYIESNFASANDKSQLSPFGFDIIFPGMLEYANDLNIKLPLNQTDLSVMLHERELELRRCYSNEKKAYLAYVSEGLGNFHDWNMVMKYQMKNGSVFNSPSATAAALIHNQNDAGCLDYLSSLLNKFGNAVPTVYPLDLYIRLCMVDTLGRLGITRHFKMEIQNVLDETYSHKNRCWVQGDSQIFMDVVTCALAFRLLRINGYQVSSDPLAKITKKGDYMSSCKDGFKDVYAALEVFKASQIIYQEELAGLGEQNSRSTDFLKREISIDSNCIHREVDDALKLPLQCSLNISNEDYLRLAVEDFNACQSIYREEIKDLERWVVEFRLDKLKFARQKTAYCYFSAASTFPSPELSDARISWAKSFEKWNVDVQNDCCSEEVRILFLAIKDTASSNIDKAFKWQERDITSHVIEIWVDVVKSMLREAIWARDGSVPTMTEYIENGLLSFALGPIVPLAIYFVGPKLSEEIVQSSEYHKLFELMSTYGRLLNDIHTFKRESKAGQLNAVPLYMSHGKSTGIMEQEAVEEIKMLMENHRREMMKLVLETKGSIVPKACKDAFWSMCNVVNLFYAKDDGYTGNAILDVVKEIIYDPVYHRPML
ncbi:unnamed protein product [Lactuca virosa]|uniref:Ent-kaurene synthase n=1 Tax=Lactuca virosa TaxID=75947 RepID=A0AAU9LKH4_9ASTR|nr:unnamed protein product [Lactuca virosa]